MGGGDLNSKKSWHPNTMKNQERVWKAEQAAAEEKKRMLELQRERAEERDHAELNSLIKHSNSSTSDNRLSWMYDKPDKKVDQEAYLLGKSIDKNAEPDKLEQDPIPAVSRRVVGSSMITAAGDNTQVDMSRKIREDPLLLIKERERAARAALLNNPLQRRRLAELLRKEQDLRKENKSKKSPKKKNKNLDDLLAAKLNALGGQKGIDLATLLNSDDSSPDSSTDDKKRSKKKKKKDKKKKKKKERKCSSDSESDDEQSPLIKKKETRIDDTKHSKRSVEHQGDKREYRRRKSSENEKYSDYEVKSKKYKRDVPERHAQKFDYENRNTRNNDKKKYDSGHYSGSQHRDAERRNKDFDKKESRRRGGMTEDEKAARLLEMAAAGAEREVERGRRVAEQRAADASDAAGQAARSRPTGPTGATTAPSHARALPDSLESRIHSTRHYIQRDKRHMNENFARR